MASRPPIALDVHAGVVRPLKTAEVVARRIVADILDQGLSTGTCLAAEAQMMDAYDVSRESLREALRLLEVHGFVTIRRGPGGGPIVGTVDPAAFGRMATMFFQMGGATYDELYDAWSAAEVLLAGLAARHPDRAHRAEVMAPFLGDGRVHEASPSSEQAEFHAALAELTGNRVLQITMQLYGQIVTYHAVAGDVAGAQISTVFHDHREIALAVRAGHPLKARAAMEDHVARVVARLRQNPDTPGDRIVAWL